MNQREVVVLSALRSPVGRYGGGLKDLSPADLGARVVREAVAQAKVPAAEIAQLVFGNVIHTEAKDMYLSRVVALSSGLSPESTALTVNRLCGSGLQAVISAAQSILLGDAEVAVGGGAESMSRGQYWMGNLRWGQRLNHATAVDAVVGALTDPFGDVHMGITAENVAKKWHISREDQDCLALESHMRAIAAIRHGIFKSQIVPIELKTKKGSVFVDTDEHPRADVTLDSLAALPPAFDKNGTVTAGNASGLNDGAAALVLMEARAAAERGLKPIGRLRGYAMAGVAPEYMGIGPVPAVRKLLGKVGLTIADIDLWEVNEAFAAQALAVIRDLGLPADKTNPNGSGIALGHPIGATGAILAVKALHELRRTHGRYAIVTMCIGGGQGIAALFEAVND
jgi:acetyl-CoA C-acetyltransferase